MEEKKYTQGKVFRRILQYAKVYKLWIFLSFFLSFLTVVLSLTLPILMGKGIDHLPGKGKADFTGLFRILLIMLLILVLTPPVFPLAVLYAAFNVRLVVISPSNNIFLFTFIVLTSFYKFNF